MDTKPTRPSTLLPTLLWVLASSAIAAFGAKALLPPDAAMWALLAMAAPVAGWVAYECRPRSSQMLAGILTLVVLVVATSVPAWNSYQKYVGVPAWIRERREMREWIALQKPLDVKYARFGRAREHKFPQALRNADEEPEYFFCIRFEGDEKELREFTSNAYRIRVLFPESQGYFSISDGPGIYW